MGWNTSFPVATRIESTLLQTAGFTLRKWASNHFTFLDNIPRGMQTNIVSLQHTSIHITDATVQAFLATEGWLEIHSTHGPHFGRLWEAAVKPMKYHLQRTLGAQIANYEELCTLLAEIDACLNSKPLCALSDDPFNPTYLSPWHFLIGEPLTHLPAADLTDVKCIRLSRWQSFQQQLQQFWQRWSSDSFQSLQQHPRWLKTSPDLQPGALVLEGGQHDSTPLAHSRGHQHPSRQRWHRSRCHTSHPQGSIQTSHYKNLALTVCKWWTGGRSMFTQGL